MTESIRFQEQFYKQVCAEPRPLAVNPALPTFAAERRAVAPCYRSPVAKLLLRPIWDRQTDGHRTVTQTLVLCTSRGQCQQLLVLDLQNTWLFTVGALINSTDLDKTKQAQMPSKWSVTKKHGRL